MINQITIPKTLILIAVCGFIHSASAHYGARFEPPDGRAYHGVGWNYQDSQNRYSQMFAADKQPLILQVNVSVPGMRGVDVARTVRALTQPIVHPDSQFVEYSMHFQGRDAAVMLDSIFVFTDQWDRYVDTLELAFRQVNRPFFFRIGFEFNGNWNPYHPFIFPRAFRKLVEELRGRGIDNFATVWCYEPDADASFADSTRLGWKWYPGDDVVDWFGLDLFQAEHFDPDLPDSAQGRNGLEITRKGKSEAFLRFAEARGKPVYLNELSSIHTSSTPDSLDPNGEDGQADWEAWFEPFFEFVAAHPNIKGWNYIDVDWSSIDHYAELGWMDSRLEINQRLRAGWVEQLNQERFLHAGSNLNWNSAPTQLLELPVVCSWGIYPNPFNSTTRFYYQLARPSVVNIAVYDAQGRLTAHISDGFRVPGNYVVDWNAERLPAGMYISRMSAGAERDAMRLMLIK